VSWRATGWAGLFLLGAGCAAAGGSDRPPAPGPAPSSAAIANLGFDGALKAGSDYVAASTGVTTAKVHQAQTLPSGMLELTFDLGPGVPEPMRVVVDPEQGKVQPIEPVPQIRGITNPTKSR